MTLPSLRPAIASSAAVVFVFSFTSLGIVLLLGDSTTRTLESQILRQTSVLLDFPGAAATALIQLVLVSGILLAGTLTGRRSGRRRMRPVVLRRAVSGQGRAGVLATAVATYVLVLAPIAALIASSLRTGNGWSLAWWQALGSVDAGTTRIGSPISALATSVGYALVAGLVASVIGGLSAMAVLTRGRARLLSLLAIVPLGISSATLGLGTLLAFGRPPIDLRGSGLLVPIAHSLVAVPLVVAVVAPALRGTDARTMSVASSLGATPTRAFLTAYGPVLRVVMLASAGLAFAVSLGEFGAASFLARAGSPTVPVQIVRLLSRPGEESYGVAAVLAVVLVVLTLVMVLARRPAGHRARVAPAGAGVTGRGLATIDLAVGYETTVLATGIDLAVAPAEIVAILGPSGSGKSTLLSTLAGIVPTLGGRILVDERDVTRLPIHRRGIGLIFQEPLLFPHLDVIGNVSYGLRRKGLSKSAAQERARRAARLARTRRVRPPECRGTQWRAGAARGAGAGPGPTTRRTPARRAVQRPRPGAAATARRRGLGDAAARGGRGRARHPRRGRGGDDRRSGPGDGGLHRLSRSAPRPADALVV